MKPIIEYFLIACLIGISLSSFSQKVKTRDIRKKADNAEKAFYEKNYYLAIELYDALKTMNPEDVTYYTYQSGLCYLYSHIDHDKALKSLEKVNTELSQSEIADLYYYHLGRAYHLHHRWEDALLQYNKAIDFGPYSKELENEINRQISICQNGKSMADTATQGVRVVNAGSGINTSSGDYKPVITADESILIFTSRRKGVTGDDRKYSDGKYYEDIFFASRDVKGNWSKPTGISPTINTEDHEASVGLSADGRELIIYKGNKKREGLFISKKTGTDWSTPEILGDGTIETKVSWETSASISADGRSVYLTSTRKGSLGERDIFRSEKNQLTGEWSSPVSLGEIVNTQYDEESPFIHPDGKTLYFASKGHNSIGGFDIFKTKLESGVWSKPVNMGYPVNSASDDVHFVLTADGKHGYFTSSRGGGLGEHDIYKVYLEGGAILLLVKGTVQTEDQQQINVDITVINKENRASQPYVYNPDPVTGKYLMILPPGKSYEMLIKAKGYEPHVAEITMPNPTEFHEVYQELLLRKIRVFGDIVGQEVTLLNSFKNLRTSEQGKEISDPGNADYLETLVGNVISKTDSMLDQGITPSEISMNTISTEVDKINTLTDKASDNFKQLVDAGLTEAKTSTHYYKDNNKLEPYTVNDQTVYVVPSSSAATDPTPYKSSSLTMDDLVRKETKDQTLLLLPTTYLDHPGIDMSQISMIIEGTDTVYALSAELTEKAKTSAVVDEPVAMANQPTQTSTEDAPKPVTEPSTETKSTENKTNTNQPAEPDNKEINTKTQTEPQSSQEQQQTPSSGDAILEKSIQFAFDKSNLENQFQNELDEIVVLLKKSSSLNAIIEGHTDSKGPETYNQFLSEKRANSVAAYLISKGISKNRLTTKGYGEAKPIAPNSLPDGSDNPGGRIKNRRTEIKVVK